MFLGQEVHNYIVYIAYFTELNLHICDYLHKNAFVVVIVNTHLTKIFMAIFAPDERLPTSATLVIMDIFNGNCHVKGGSRVLKKMFRNHLE